MSHQQNTPRPASWWLSPGTFTTHSVHINRRQQTKVQPRIVYPQFTTHPSVRTGPHTTTLEFHVFYENSMQTCFLWFVFLMLSKLLLMNSLLSKKAIKWKSSDIIEFSLKGFPQHSQFVCWYSALYTLFLSESTGPVHAVGLFRPTEQSSHPLNYHFVKTSRTEHLC